MGGTIDPDIAMHEPIDEFSPAWWSHDWVPVKHGTTAIAPSHKLTEAALAAAPAGKQKQMVGDHLYPAVFELQPELAGKITGMLLEMENPALLELIAQRVKLKVKVYEAVCLIKGEPITNASKNTSPRTALLNVNSAEGSVTVNEGNILDAKTTIITHQCCCILRTKAKGVAEHIFRKWQNADVYKDRRETTDLLTLLVRTSRSRMSSICSGNSVQAARRRTERRLNPPSTGSSSTADQA